MRAAILTALAALAGNAGGEFPESAYEMGKEVVLNDKYVKALDTDVPLADFMTACHERRGRLGWWWCEDKLDPPVIERRATAAEWKACNTAIGNYYTGVEDACRDLWKKAQ